MSTSSESAAAKRSAALDRLKFKKAAKAATTSSSASLAPTMNNQPPYNQLPQQSRDASNTAAWFMPQPAPLNQSSQPFSTAPAGEFQVPYASMPQNARDATVSSRFFTPGPPSSPGNILVPSSSPLAPTNSTEVYRPYSHITGGGSMPNMPAYGWAQGSTAIDPLSRSTGFRAAASNSLHHPRPISEDNEPPRKRQHLDQLSPSSPAIQRAPRRRVLPSGSDEAPSSDELPDVATALADKPRIVRKVLDGSPAPGGPVLAGPDEDTLFTRFKYTMPQERTERVKAAWVEANKDLKLATELLLDPKWQPSISPAKEATGRVEEHDAASKAQREMDKERAKKSLIYANRGIPRTTKIESIMTPTPSLTATPSSTRSSSRAAPDYSYSTFTPTALPSRRRIKRRVMDSESEPDMSDSDDEPDSKKPRQDNPQAHRALEYFNTKGPEGLQELTGCTPEQAKKIIELRPFESVEDLNARLGQGKKKAGPAGISPKMFEDSTSIFEGYGNVDRVLGDVENIGNNLRSIIDSWTSSTAKGKEKEFVEDGSLSLTSISPVNSHKPDGYVDTQPSLLSPDVQLKEYQLLGVNWLNLVYRENLSCILADEMGLGKTIQVISFFAYLKEQGHRGPHLIIVPSSTLENWLREFNRFAPSISVHAYYGGKDDRMNLRQELMDTCRSKNPEGWEVLVTTYNLAQGENDRKFFRRIEWDCCVFDEGHVLKNFQSQRYQYLLKIESNWRLLLTGTPLQNNLQELVSLLNFILPSQFTELLESLRAIFKVKGDSKVSMLAQERVSRAKKMLTPFVLRRRKDQVLGDLPKKTERIEWCEMTPLQQSIYEDAKLRSRKTVLEIPETPSAESTDGPSKGRGAAKGKKGKEKSKAVYLENSSNVLMDLRKAASHPMLFRKLFDDDTLGSMTKQLLKEPDFKKRGALFDLVKEDMTVMTDAELQLFCGTYKCLKKYTQDIKCYLDSGKIQTLLRLLEQYQNEGRKILIFSQFTQILDILQAILKQHEIRYLLLTGSTAVDIRQTLVDEFTEDENIPVFLLSTKAGGMGINLTAASVVIMFDHDFNPHNDRQAQDRAYRIGQKRDVDVVKLVSRGTIEEDMLRLGETKLALDEAVAGEGDEKGESAPEREMKMSLMKSLRQQFEKEHNGTEA